MLIAQHMARRPNFIRYTYNDCLISDALLSFCQYVHNFDLTKTTNGFAYATTLMWNAMIRRIQTEQKQSYVKALVIRHAVTFDTLEGDDGQYSNGMQEFLMTKGHEIIAKFEDTKRALNAKANTKRAAA